MLQYLFKIFAIFLFAGSCIALSGCSRYNWPYTTQGYVYTNDGSILSGSVTMPVDDINYVLIKNADNNEINVSAKEISRIEVWNTDEADKYVLMYLPTVDKKGKERPCRWMSANYVGPNLIIYLSAFGYMFDNTTNTLVARSDSPKGMCYYAQKKGESHATWIAQHDGNLDDTRRRLIEYLSDDADLCKRIAEPSFHPHGFKTIVSEYNPNKNKNLDI